MMHCFHLPDQVTSKIPDMNQVFSHVTTARPNLPRPPSLAELHLPRPPQLGNCFPKRSETDRSSKLSGLQAHLANIQPPNLGGKFQSLKSLGGNSVGGSQASSSTGTESEASGSDNWNMEGMASRVKRRACSGICSSSCFKNIIGKGESESENGSGVRRRRGIGVGPGAMGRRGRGKEPPEITYLFQSNSPGTGNGATDGGSIVDGTTKHLSLQSSFAPSLPMPGDEDELNEKFCELVEELDLSAVNRTAMMSLPNEKKWQLYCSQRLQGSTNNSGQNDRNEHNRDGCVQSVWTTGGLSNDPQAYVDKVRISVGMLEDSCPSPSSSPTPHHISTDSLDFQFTGNGQELDQARLDPQVRNLFDSLQIALRTQPNSFVMRFIDDADGLSALLDFLAAMDYVTLQSPIHTAALSCLKALMNNSTGRAHVLAHATGINIIAQSLATENTKTKVAVLEILGAMCLVPGGHKKVLEAMLHYQEFSAERTRFQGIINDLDRSTGKYRDDVNLKTAIMSFINAVLNYGPGHENLEFRLHLRYELLMLGIQPVIDKLRKHENETLNRHLEFFEMVRVNDEKELAKRYDQVHIDTKSSQALFETLRSKLNHTAAFPHFMSLLQHCILLPLDYGSHPQHWLLFDRLVQQIVLQTSQTSQNSEAIVSEDHDPIAPLNNLNVKEIVHQLGQESEISELRVKTEDMEKENIELATNLSKKEQELDAKAQEKEDLESNLERAREKLETEVARHTETKQRLAEIESRLQGSSLSSLSGDVVGFIPPPPAPPLPAPMAPPPPPGPPPMPGTTSMIGDMNQGYPGSSLPSSAVRKNIPKSANPLKSFNWSKLPDCKVPGTIWTELDETNLYLTIDLNEIDKLFSAYQKNGLLVDGVSIEDLRNLGSTLGRGHRNKVISVIDSRRAQNCTILLSKLKMPNEDITKAIMSMDARANFPTDMVEQMLKFTPTPEERAMLDEHAEEMDHLARADRFLFELSKITHYEQRLRTLHYKKKFNIWYAEFKPKIVAVLEASREVQRSKRLKKMLEIILAFGNYMNRGQRGNAVGFKLSSLTRIADTKSSCNKNMTLLHYIADTCEHKFRDCLMLEVDLPHVKDAAKVNMKELEKDMAMLRNGMKEVGREVEFFRTQTPLNGDRYLPVMKEFVSGASVRLAELEDLFVDMKARFDRVCKLFCEDPATSQSDEFFGVFDIYITTLTEARAENDNIRRKKEEEEKVVKQHQEMRMRTLERKKSNASRLNSYHKSSHSGNGNTSPTEKNEFDDLISALRTGDVFGESVDKYTQKRWSSTRGHHAERLHGAVGSGKIRHSPPRVDRTDSFLRERISNNTKNMS